MTTAAPKHARTPALPTRNPRPSNARAAVIEILQGRLADGIDLALATKQAHWNLKGPQFIAIHLMLDGFRTEQDDWVDTIAERIVQLGGIAHGTTQAVAAASKLSPYPTDAVAIPEHLEALIERSVQFAHAIAENTEDATQAGDADTADIFTQVSRALEKQLWFLEAHLPQA